MTSPQNSPAPLALSRREAIRRILAATAFLASTRMSGFAAEGPAVPKIGFDPDLLKKEIPWPRLLTPTEKQTVTALADLIIPADEHGPAASAVGVPDFIDEWVSAPYDQQVRDCKVIRDGLAWIDQEAQSRFRLNYAASTSEQQTAILQDIVTEGTTARQQGRAFFIVLRDRVAGGYYTTQEGWKALGYMGNTPSADFAGPPPEVLQRLGLEAA